ncbi:helix-turn-helix transcriptional regulator [Brevundimonas sp. BAL450]|uniref:helix-turn-helix domain-containing protein n=1 Tax=Brevundimonas sp. BAL450 TaxID=1708162 RepID=UPI0018CB319C|nr:helix-turn-helix transcriptional regulator [Brevundimonas sp. BAL450]MBG7613856.1 helix-turn-helix transcriptional regulator [Brevundimonas sp. BAL450]
MPRTALTRPHPFDIEVGARIAFRRRELGLSQTNLGQAVGITFQQVQKYERGTNRVSASRLYEMSKVLNVTCGWLMGEDGAPGGDDLGGVDAASRKLLVAWGRLSERDRGAVLALIRTLSSPTPAI